jgi:UDP-N-acetylmuramoylalanine-D-glutamate ligase
MLRDLILSVIENKRVLILGFGKEGQSTYSYIRNILPEKELFISDRNPKPDIKDQQLSN